MGFFDNLSKKATETYKNTTDKTNKMAREMRLKSYIGENKNRIHGIYTEIGKKVYEKHVEGKISEIEEYIKPELEQIAEVARKIDNMNNEIRALNNLKICQSCASEIDLNARFCPICGVKQYEEEKKEDTNDVDNAINLEASYPVQIEQKKEEDNYIVESNEIESSEIESNEIESNEIERSEVEPTQENN